MNFLLLPCANRHDRQILQIKQNTACTPGHDNTQYIGYHTSHFNISVVFSPHHWSIQNGTSFTFFSNL